MADRLRILTLTQPWATLVAIGAKRVETRSWSTPYRGYLGIHAAKGFPRDAIELCFTEPFRRYLKGRRPSELPRGELICVARLQSVVPTRNVQSWISEDERAFGDYSDGRFAWVMGAPPPHALPAHIPLRGSLGLWTPPADVLEQLVALGFENFDEGPQLAMLPSKSEENR